MAIQLRQLSHAAVQRNTNTQQGVHRGLSVGMIRDVDSYLGPEGSCWDASDMLCDLPGRIRKRGGMTSPSSSNRAAVAEHLLSYKSNGVDGATGLFGFLGKGGVAPTFVTYLDRTTGAATALSAGGATSAGFFAAKPFQHANYGVFMSSILNPTTNDVHGMLFNGGATVAGSTLTAATVTANDNRVTGITGISVLAGHLGALITMKSAGNLIYTGRIVEVTSTSAVRVEPTPLASLTATSGAISAVASATSLNTAIAGVNVITGRYGLSFQGRIVIANTRETQGTSSANFVNGLGAQPNRVYWSQLRTEAIPATVTGTLDGDPILYPGIFLGTPTTPYFNYVDIPDIGGITGIAKVGDGELLVFGPRSMYKITGQLTTETEANNTTLFTVDQVSANVGIPNPNTASANIGDQPYKSIQYTPFGIVFASTDNIYLYDGSSLKGLLDGRNQKYYALRRTIGTPFTAPIGCDPIYGSAYNVSKNAYYLSMGGGDFGLMIDLQTHAVTRMTGVQVFDSAPDPTDQTILWMIQWWDTTGAAPTFTKGQLYRLDPIWSPTSANIVDPGNNVIPTFTSKAYMDGTLEANKLFRGVHIDYVLATAGAPTVTVTADTKLDPSDAVFVALTQGSLPVTGTTGRLEGAAHLDVTNQLREGKAIELFITLSSNVNTFEILGFNFQFQERALT